MRRFEQAAARRVAGIETPPKLDRSKPSALNVADESAGVIMRVPLTQQDAEFGSIERVQGGSGPPGRLNRLQSTARDARRANSSSIRRAK